AQASAKSAIENLRDAGAAELVSELDVVLSRLPRHVVDVMPVGVHTLAGIGFVRAELREPTAGWAADVEHWQSKVVGVSVVYAAGPHAVQPQGTGIKAAILGKKSFRKPIPAQSRFVDDRGAYSTDEGNGNQLDTRGYRGVIAGKQAAAGQGERETLIAVTEVVAAGQQIILADVLIELDDGAVYTIRKWRSDAGVVAAVVVAIHAGIGGSGPSLA